MTQYIVGQEKQSSIPDSLKGKSYDYLFDQASNNYTDTISSLVYLNTALEKAIKEDHKGNHSHALIQLAYYAKDTNHKLNLIKESILKSNETDSVYSILPRFTLGLYYQHHFNYEKALEEYIIVLNTSKKIGSAYYEYLTLNHIAELKAAVGKHKEAITLYKKSLSYENSKKFVDTVNTADILMHLSESMRYLKKYDSASYYYKRIKEIAPNLSYYLNIATINQGINLYKIGTFKESERLLNKGIDKINVNYSNSKKYYILSQFYLGKISQQAQGNNRKAREYFLSVDSLATTTDLVIPETRGIYEFLISNYKKQKDLHLELATINKLMRFDSIVATRNIGIVNKLHTEYDTPQLLKNKEALIKKLEQKTTLLTKRTLYLTFFIILLTTLILLFIINRKKEKNRFNVIISQLENQKAEKNHTRDSSIVKRKVLDTIDEATISEVLEKLEQFEEKEEFLQKNITLALMAKKCKTNTKYLPKIITTYKGKTFVNYINNLRINYILKELKENPIIQKYTIKTISEEAGFNNPESFVKAFKNKTNLRPSYYIRNLKKNGGN